MQTPSVGRIVHYVRTHDAQHIAGIITEVLDSEKGIACLTIFQPDSKACPLYSQHYDARMSPSTWHYPEHVGTVQWHESEEIPAPRTAED